MMDPCRRLQMYTDCFACKADWPRGDGCVHYCQCETFVTPWFDGTTGREVVPIPAPFLAAFDEDGPTGRKD